MAGQFNFKKQPLDKIKSEVSLRLVYLQLVGSLIPARYPVITVAKDIADGLTWLSRATEAELRRKAPEVVNSLGPLMKEYGKILHPRKSWRKIAEEYWQLTHEAPFDWRKGITHQWIAERFDCSNAWFPSDLPYHARIGIWHHRGLYATEEFFTLQDAAYMLERARRAYAGLVATRDWSLTLPDPDQNHPLMRSLADNVRAYSVLAVISFYAFVEAFINSVASDYVARNPSRSPDALSTLQGFTLSKNGRKRYWSIEDKMESYPGIIRGTNDRYLILTDPVQTREPFRSFAGHIKEVRDAANHYALQKANIWLSPQDWLSTADAAANTCVAVAQGFWSACYPERSQPKYLDGLKMEKLVAQAQERLAREEAAKYPGQDGASPEK